MQSGEYMPQERAMLLGWLIADMPSGHEFTTASIMERIGSTDRNVRDMLSRASRVLPIRYEGEGRGRIWIRT